ncbi:hypothetical protein ACLOJK_018730, partial [Asimina triloba]
RVRSVPMTHHYSVVCRPRVVLAAGRYRERCGKSTAAAGAVRDGDEVGDCYAVSDPDAVLMLARLG